MTTLETSGRALTESSAVELAAAIRSGRVRARQVVDEHIELIEARNPRVNAIVATRFDEARAEADAADELVASGREAELPPLLGVPCTIKESFGVAGMPQTSGSLARAEVVAERSATAVQRLVDAGAIPLGVTNTSQLTLWIESDNPVWGRTDNAYDPSRTAGGSSGGEGAAIGSGFAPIGLGTDIGGSIRLPAFFNGVFGHKPTGALVPHTGHYPAPNERGSALLGTGPLTRRAEDLMPALRAIAGPDGIDQTVHEAELGDPAQVSIEGLRVVISDDATMVPVALELRNARDPRRPRAARCRGRGRARLAARGEDGDAALPERHERVGRPPRAAHRGRRPGARLRAAGRRRGARAQPLHDAALDDARLGEPLRAHPRALSAAGAGGRAGARRAGRRGDRRRGAPASAVRARRPAPRPHGRPAVDARPRPRSSTCCGCR